MTLQLTNRERLIGILDLVAPGMEAREVVEQSSCFVFDGSRVMTFNDELFCHMPLPDDLMLEGAVAGKKLLESLRKYPDEDIKLEVKPEALIVKAKGRTTKVNREAEIKLPVNDVEKVPDDAWVTCTDDFLAGLKLVVGCCSTQKDAMFGARCVHVTPDHLEACDNYQLSRYLAKTDLGGRALLKSEWVPHILNLGANEMAMTEAWVHFRNATGLNVACRRYVEDFMDIEKVLVVENTQAIALPPGLTEALDRCMIFSNENSENNRVRVRLKPGKMELHGEGHSGTHTERRQINYDGPAIDFYVAPDLLASIVDRHKEAEINEERIVFDSDVFRYVACLIPSDK